MTDPELEAHAAAVRACRLCPGVQPPPVCRAAARTPVYLMGQAPGPTEREEGRGFCGSAGRTLFRWLASIGVDEATFRERVFMGAVIRCWPGRQASRGGDRRPAPAEIANCRRHFERELELLRPRLVLLVGKLAMERFLGPVRLDDVVGRPLPVEYAGHAFEGFPLPHPSGLNRWISREPGRTRVREALERLSRHPVWQAVFPEAAP